FRRFDAWQDSSLVPVAEATLADGVRRSIETRVAGEFPDERWINAHFTTFKRGDSAHLLMMFSDVSKRVRASAELAERTEALQRFSDEREAENALAADVMQRMMRRPGLSDRHIRHWLQPATAFSGDVVAAARSAEGKLYVLLADATGHGLTAAISVVPALTVFYSLAEAGYPLGFIALQINSQLLAFLPTGRFVAATLLCLHEATRTVEVWQGGMPNLMLLGRDGRALNHLPTSHPPLGILEFDEEMAAIERFDCPPDSQLVLHSDGLTEAVNDAGEAFGPARLLAALAGVPAEGRIAAVQAAYRNFVGDVPLADDVSLVLISC
ncbi:MAG TPA: PP2C family protein-serine/threonine phosphatase, partial [Rhodocyclaceae bacterium]|nr:PP2C family protein-serine/threonine phosphatase [Rhodocyclaceae bacterium]